MGTVSRRFGKPAYLNGAESAIVYKGTIDDASEVTFTFEPSSLYELFTAEYNASTGAYRGHRLVEIYTPEEDIFGTTACNRGNAYASTNAGVTFTWNTDSTLTIKRNATTYAVKYVIRKVGSNIGNPSSAINEAEAAAQAAQAAASKAEAAAEHYPYIGENLNWYYWDVQAGAFVDSGITARGVSGVTPDLTIGTVTTGQAGSQASATITGTDEEPVLNLTIPRGIAGGTQQDLLWTNPDPTSNFAAQTVALDLSGYDAVMIETLRRKSTSYGSNNFGMVGSVIVCTAIGEGSTSWSERQATISSTGIQFNGGYLGTTSNNEYAIPQKIYGIKGINARPAPHIVELLPKSETGLSSSSTITAIRKTFQLSDDISNYDMVQVLLYSTWSSTERQVSETVMIPTYDGGVVAIGIYSDSNASYYCMSAFTLHGNEMDVYRAFYSNNTAPILRVIGVQL